jgi:hypothetical protein
MVQKCCRLHIKLEIVVKNQRDYMVLFNKISMLK